MFAAPLAVVAASRMVLAPALRPAGTLTAVQFVHAPVGAKPGVATTVPLTETVAGRAAVEPLAKPKASVTGPAVAASTVHCTKEPVALVVLQKPVPEKPAQLESIVPSHVPLSASCRPGGGG